jgi:sirohydrochlorin ferrochelatase
VPDILGGDMTTTSENTGLIIICHGSPLKAANTGFIALVDRIAAKLGVSHVLPAFLAIARPTIQDQIAELASRGVTRIVLMPYFLFQGRHVDIDIPNILRESQEWFPGVTLELLPTLENDPAVEEVVVQRLMPLAAGCNAPQRG